MANSIHDYQCPLAAIDQRLDDLHRLWHQAESAYFDPGGFRVAIQAAIQTMRTVTFILQKNKANIPDFDQWYAPWQKKLAADALMVWMRDARNNIEKEGDLEAHSFIRAEIVASYLDNGPTIDVPAKLSDAPAQLLASIPKDVVGKHIFSQGFLRIQRQWVENTLPNYELLDAIAVGYGRIAELVADAHKQLGLLPPQTTDQNDGQTYPINERAGRLPCMIGHADKRTLDIWLASGEPVKFEEITQKVESGDREKIEARYDVDLRKMYATVKTTEDFFRQTFEHARVVFEKDGYHCTIVFLVRDNKPLLFKELRPGEHGHKYLMMRSVAHDVVRLGADSVFLLGEMWSAPADPANPMMRAADSPDRRELLASTLVSKSGEPIHLSAEIERKGKKAKLADTTEHRDGAHFNFAPVYKAWGKPIPSEWSLPASDSARHEGR